MILTNLGPITVYRMLVPRWASTPTSGAGAALHGGRANRPGTQALYLALEAETAVREYQQLSPLMPPGTLVSYTVRLAPVADFQGGYEPGRWSDLWEEFYCDWRELWFNRRVEPPSWVLADDVIAAGAKGLLFASTIVNESSMRHCFGWRLGFYGLATRPDARGNGPLSSRRHHGLIAAVSAPRFGFAPESQGVCCSPSRTVG